MSVIARIFQNYHRHTHRTNVLVPDSTVSNEDYAKRAVELGHGIISTMEHGNQGCYIEGYNLAQQHNLKFVFGAEAYWVKDRTVPDPTNGHIYIGARNENGRQCINDILSEANLTGFYKRPRIDVPLLLSLPKDDVIVTSACVAFWKYDDVEDIVQALAQHFEKNFFLEVQYHLTDAQRQLNQRILAVRDRLKIPIIMGCDSHYIFPRQSQDRDDFLLSKGISYEDEEGWYLDYPDGDETYQRFCRQGILSEAQIDEAMSNTNVFLDVERYDSEIFNANLKLPKLPEMKDWTQAQRDEAYERLVWQGWDRYKPSVPEELHPHYESEIQNEINSVKECHMADYFLIDHEIVKRGKEMGGLLTKTGRGSAVSFITNMLLGFTEVDRIAAKVKMYPDRFMTATRILQAGTLPDIDLNMANPPVFAKAQQEILGEDHAYPMISYHPMKTSKAWKLYAKSQGVSFDEANAVSEQIRRYEEAVKQADEDSKDDIDIMDYISDEYREIFAKSADYRGITDSWSIAPCGYLLYEGSIRRQIGLVRINNNICCMMDGHWAEDGHFLKNDLLKVSVVNLINMAYERIGMKVPTVNELLAMCPPEDPAWDIYKKGCCMGVNQVERKGTAARCTSYQPRNISELCAFVAAIRPGFKSMYKTFESRKPFEYGVKAFDNILKTEELPFSFCLYQEQEMAALNYAGIPMSECYVAIKDIAKKRAQKVLAYKEKFISGFRKAIIEDEGKSEAEAEEIAEMLWKIIEDSARYSFNACVSADTRLSRAGVKGHWNPTVEEMYLIKNFSTYAEKTQHLSLHKKYVRSGYGNALSMWDDFRVRKNSIVDIRPAGEREVFRIKTSGGRAITCTGNHKFPTPDGEKCTSDLKAGDVLYVIGDYEKCDKRYRFTDGSFKSNVPARGQQGFQRMPNGNSTLFRQRRKRFMEQKAPCAICSKEYSPSERFELHHRDGNRTNSSEENLQWLCCSCHKKEEYQKGRRKMYDKGILVATETIVSITSEGIQRTYNVEMADPSHNFVTDSGVVTSNSHSYCVSCDSLYIAWVKAHHPLELYETLLKFYDSRGEKDKIAEAKAEARRFFDIKFPPMRFGQDNRAIAAHAGNNQITESISTIKGFSATIGKHLWNAAQSPHENFMSLLLDLDQRGIKAKVEPLIKIDYFQQYGNQRELMKMWEIFNYFKQGTAKSLKREAVDGTILENPVRSHATWLKKDGTEAKSYTLTDVMAILSEVERLIRASNLPDINDVIKIRNYCEIMGQSGYISGKEDDRPKLFVKEVFPLKRKSDGKQFGYSILTQSIGSGIESRFTVFNRVYELEPIKKDDVICVLSWEREKGQYFTLKSYRHIRADEDTAA